MNKNAFDKKTWSRFSIVYGVFPVIPRPKSRTTLAEVSQLFDRENELRKNEDVLFRIPWVWFSVIGEVSSSI